MTERDKYLALVCKTIGEVIGIDPDELEETTDLKEVYGIDSLELMEIGARLEMALVTRLSLADLITVRTVKQAVDMLMVHQGVS